ncbi:hypothetical protein [Actinacidiphila glaucinigra]|uniref:hypothetical protein n=1 Tax=Actinacidiphila glaucinigra TaxID=235986 RepID=UPI00366DFBBA
MPRKEPAGPPVAGNRFVVPDIEPGDVGLVAVVHDVAWDGHSGMWWVLLPENRQYKLPFELNDWAGDLDNAARRRFVRLPAAYAFGRIRGQAHARKLSAT